METKLLDLNAYGVSELSNVEMREIDGGWGLLIKKAAKGLWKLCRWGVGLLLADAACNPHDTADAWNAGKERAMQ